MLGFLSRGARAHVAMIDRHLRPFLRRHGFRLKEVRGPDHEWTALYASQRCRLAINDSARNGEVNCLIALPSASTAQGMIDRQHGWRYLHGFIRRGLSEEELLALSPARPRSRDEQMRSIAEGLTTHYDAILEWIAMPDAGEAGA